MAILRKKSKGNLRNCLVCGNQRQISSETISLNLMSSTFLLKDEASVLMEVLKMGRQIRLPVMQIQGTRSKYKIMLPPSPLL